MLLLELVLFTAIVALAFACVAAFRKWAIWRSILDHPNERSSHTAPTPRGGGFVFAAICLMAYALVGYWHPSTFSWTYFLGAFSIAAVGWLDDLYSIGIQWKLLLHSLAAGALLAELGYFREAGVSADVSLALPGFIGVIATFLWLVWTINAFNFIDGIDGIAGLQAVIAAVGWWLFCYQLEIPIMQLYVGVLGASVLGFLMLNWHPAKIFMGDVGSSFLGFTLGAMPLLVVREKQAASVLVPVAAIIFVWFLFFDTAVSRFRRMFTIGRFWEPHREHFYQRLVRSGYSHSSVALWYGIASVIMAIEMVLFVRAAESMILPLGLSLVLLSSLIVIIASTKKELT